MTEKQKPFLVTRPRWASFLMEQGYDGNIMPNPWKPHLTAWAFDLTPDLAQVLVKLYASVDQLPPVSVSSMAMADRGIHENSRMGGEGIQ